MSIVPREFASSSICNAETTISDACDSLATQKQFKRVNLKNYSRVLIIIINIYWQSNKMPAKRSCRLFGSCILGQKGESNNYEYVDMSKWIFSNHSDHAETVNRCSCIWAPLKKHRSKQPKKKKLN